MNIKLGTMPGQIREYALGENTRVSEAIDTAGICTAGYEVRVNGEPADMNAVLRDGDQVLLVKQVKGNR